MVQIVVTNQWKSEFKYDGFGRRRVRQEYNWVSGNWSLASETRYVYDGMLAIQERDGNNAVKVTYTRGLDESGTLQGAGGIGGLLARTENTSYVMPRSYYISDVSGNVAGLVNIQEIIVARYVYDPFGRTIGMSGWLADANPYRFSSKEQHGQSGLYYYGYRFYEPNLQRWLNQDPIGEQGFEAIRRASPFNGRRNSRVPAELSQGPNLYTFVQNDPANRIDPLGLFGFGLTFGASGTAGAGPGWTVGGSAGVGLFVGPNPCGTKATLGGYLSGGLSLPDSYHLGLGGGYGGGAFFTDADYADQLADTSNTVFLNIGFGIDLGISFSWGNGIHILEVTAGPGGGLSIGSAPTTTHTGTLQPGG